MKQNIKRTIISASIVAALGSLSLSSAGAQQLADWYADPALTAKVKKDIRINFRKRKTVLNAVVKNIAEDTSKGEHRLVVKTYRHVLNADGYTDEGYPFINVCDTNCSISSSDKEKVKIIYKARFFDLFFVYKPLVIAENVPYTMQLLHNADMDGTSGALQNVQPFSAVLGALQAEYPENTLIASSGDNYIPGPRFSASSDESLNPLLGIAGEGRADMAFMNAMGYQVSAVGNHDLDTGTAGFAAIINQEFNAEGAVYSGAQFPYLSSNLDFSTDENLAPLIGTDGSPANTLLNNLAKYTVVEVAGETIGVVGATTPKLASITSTGDISILPEDGDDIAALAAEIQQSVDALKSLGINKIVLLAHMQTISIEKQLAQLLSGVDIIVAGGSNTLLADSNDVLLEGDTAADTYPLSFTSAANEPVVVVNTDGDYKYLGRLVSQFDSQGHLISERLDDIVNGAYASDDRVLESLGNPVANAEVKQISTAVSNILAERDGNIVGRSSVYLDGRRSQVRSQETNMGNLTADANLAIAQQFDSSVQISLKNGGGIRDDIGFFAFPPGSTSPEDLQFFPTAPNPAANKQEGDVSQFDIQGTLRFNNGLTLITLTASELYANIEHGVANAGEGIQSGRFPQVGGIKFSWDPALPANSRIQSLVVMNNDGTTADVIVENGNLVGDANRTFRMVTLDFLYNNCGDGYPLPGCNDGQVTPTVDPETVYLSDQGIAEGDINFAAAGSEQDAMAEYLNANYSDTAFDIAETDAAQDERIQNLSVRADTVINP